MTRPRTPHRHVDPLYAEPSDEDWIGYRNEVDSLTNRGLSLPDALRRAYRDRYGNDCGPVDPGPLLWLWKM